MDRRRPSRLAIAIAAALTLGCAAALLGLGGSGAQAQTTSPCGFREPQAGRISHVIVIFEENHSFSQILGPAGSPQQKAAPYLNSLARHCGLATNYHAVTHGSMPDYMAATGGVAVRPRTTSTGPSIFEQVAQAGMSWRAYMDGMPGWCDRTERNTSPAWYKTGHNPALWYAGLARGCLAYDVPVDPNLLAAIRKNALPNYAFVSPNTCHDMHQCAYQVQRADRYLAWLIPQITATRAYRNGRVAIFITWDEGGKENGSSPTEDCLAAANVHDESCHVPLLVLSASTAPGMRTSVFLTHYSLLRSSEALLGLPALGHAADGETRGLRAAFRL